MNPSDHIETPAAYSRESVVAYLQAAESEQARIRQAIADANARASRARECIASLAQAARDRDRVQRLGVLQVEVDNGSMAGPASGFYPTPDTATPVAEVPMAPVPVDPQPVVTSPDAVPLGAAAVSGQDPDLWVRPVPDGPADPFPYRSIRPMPVPDTREPAATWPSAPGDEPTGQWHLTAPMERVAGD